MVSEADYSSLMDRFRGRLVVPIFDATGKKVLGFGGRILSKNDNDIGSRKFKPPKYLNSPESKIFKKKAILFGQQIASEAMEASTATPSVGGTINKRSLVIVEGYMDAMALWQAGIQTVTSCMGTGLTTEQLVAATRIARLGNGMYSVVFVSSGTQ